MNFTSTSVPSTTQSSVKENGFINGIGQSLLLVMASELGDRTFIISAVLAMRKNKMVVFMASALAQTVSVIISIGFGYITKYIPSYITYYASIILFIMFGVMLLYQSRMAEPIEEFGHLSSPTVSHPSNRRMSPPKSKSSSQTTIKSQTGLESNQREENSFPKRSSIDTSAKLKAEFGEAESEIYQVDNLLLMFHIFSAVLCGEIGDKSQFSIITLANQLNVYGVAIGALIGHWIILAVAVVGGSYVGRFLAPSIVYLFGGLLFLAFALYFTLLGPPKEKKSNPSLMMIEMN